MKYGGLFGQTGGDVLWTQLGVRAVAAGKGEGALPLVGESDEGQGGEGVGGDGHAGHIHPRLGQGVYQKSAVQVRAHLADQGGGTAAPGGRGQHIGGRAAGILLKQAAAARRAAVLGKIHQKLAQSHNIVCHKEDLPAPAAHANFSLF